MTAYNIVRYRIKSGQENAFLEKHKAMHSSDLQGMRKGTLIKTGDSSYCFIGEWDSFDNIVTARPLMLAILDGFRDMLEDLGGDLGVTDAVSGEAVLDI
jgi:hypothetical protein